MPDTVDLGVGARWGYLLVWVLRGKAVHEVHSELLDARCLSPFRVLFPDTVMCLRNSC
jgi:hypothetical protein